MKAPLRTRRILVKRWVYSTKQIYGSQGGVDKWHVEGFYEHVDNQGKIESTEHKVDARLRISQCRLT